MRLSSFLYALALTNLYCSVSFLLQRRFTQEFQPNHCPMMQKVLFPLTSVAQERCSSSSLLKNEQDNRDTAPLSVVKFCNSLIHSLTIANRCKLLPSPVNDIPLYVNSCQRLPCSLRVQNVVESLQMVTLGAFHSTKIPVRNFGNSTCLMGRYIPVGYCSCKQDTKERYWGQHFVKWKGSFRSDQLK